MAQPLLSENTGVDERDELIESLQSEIYQLKRDVMDKSRELRIAQQQAGKSIEHLRQVLTPLYRGLQEVFGEMESVAPEQATNGNGAVPDSKRAVWESWKSKLGGSAAKIIDALLLHGEMNTQQLAIAVGLHRTTIPALIYKLNQAGLINKSGGKFSLKQL